MFSVSSTCKVTRLKYSKKVMIHILINILMRCYTSLKMQMLMLSCLKIWIVSMQIEFSSVFVK